MGLAFLVKDLKNAVICDAELFEDAEWPRRGTIQHFALASELGVVAGAEIHFIVLGPVHGAGKMRAFAVEDEQVPGIV
jgi:hypothetical protein